MKVLILAAGRGTRISRYLSGMPKCTVDIGGERLIRHTVRLLQKYEIRDVGIVLGYRQEAVREVLAGLDVTYYVNPFYDVTNSIASAWFARDFFNAQQDMMIMNGDVYIDGDLLEELLAETRSPVMFSDETRKETADYKFYYENEVLIKYGKELEGDDITGEYIGIARFNRTFVPEFLTKMDEMIANQQHSVWWENVLYELSARRDIYVRDIRGRFWAEVDYIEDYERILEHRKSDF
ncbi:MAG: phosphocholine cytidylyltransferase family protein [Clostridiales bacterium]|nr:phosphocholine cytidylyltransferase family protein [Clostridiales bacterium]